MAIVLAFTFAPNAVSPQVYAIATFAHTVASLALVVITCRLVAAPASPAYARRHPDQLPCLTPMVGLAVYCPPPKATNALRVRMKMRPSAIAGVA